VEIADNAGPLTAGLSPNWSLRLATAGDYLPSRTCPMLTTNDWVTLVALAVTLYNKLL